MDDEHVLKKEQKTQVESIKRHICMAATQNTESELIFSIFIILFAMITDSF